MFDISTTPDQIEAWFKQLSSGKEMLLGLGILVGVGGFGGWLFRAAWDRDNVKHWRDLVEHPKLNEPPSNPSEAQQAGQQLPEDQKRAIEVAVNQALTRRTITVGGESNSVTNTTTTSATVIDFGPYQSTLNLHLQLTLAPSQSVTVALPREPVAQQSPNIVFASLRGAHILEDMDGSTHWTISEVSGEDTFRALLVVF